MKLSHQLIWYVLANFLPHRFRFALLRAKLGFILHPTAQLSRFALILPRVLIMGEQSKIDAFTVAVNLDKINLEEHAQIGRSNWITGYALDANKHFSHCTHRDPTLWLGRHSAITKHHMIDCTDRISIGDFTTVAGYRSQLMTHGIDYVTCRQDCAPIHIGSYCLVGTNVVLLSGATLPDRSVLAAGALLNKAYRQTDMLYAGVPATPKRSLPLECKYMKRSIGFVD